jgi:large subunit ribosomal protein L10
MKIHDKEVETFMSSTTVLELKKAKVQEIQTKIEAATSVVLVNYRGLNVEEVTELRNNYREAGIEYKVYKNNMMRFAFAAAGFEGMSEFLKGPNGVAFCTDEVTAARITKEFADKHDALELKAGVVAGEVMGLDKITEIANLPTKEILLTRLVIALNSPISKLARVAKAIAEKQEEGGEAPVEAAPVETEVAQDAE